MRSVVKGLLVASVSVGLSYLQPFGIEAQSADSANSNAAHVTGLTADNQGSSSSDIAMTARIRRDVMDRDNLSTRAKNIKIITVGGKVVLKGDIPTGDERTVLLGIATSHAGADNVQDELVLKNR